eukprot:COSAG01_NODE_34012_length_555_cov_0.603070_1_plen_54_part_10
MRAIVGIGFTIIFEFFFKQRTAYGISECDWSSDVCASDLFSATRSAGSITYPVS